MSGLIFSKIEKNLALDCLLSAALFFAMATGSAQSLRDPTLPPMVPTIGKTAVVPPSLSIGTGPPSIIVRDGRSYVVLESHLYAQGQRYGGVLIEQIGETEVWFRERNILYKIPRFPNSRRSIAAPSVRTQPAAQFPEHVVP